MSKNKQHASRQSDDSESLALRIEANQNELLKSFMDLVWNDMTSLKTDIESVKHTVSTLMDDNLGLTQKVKHLERKLKVSDGLLTQAKKKIEQQDVKLLHLQARSMRDNLVFGGIDEKENENWHETEAKMKNFLKQELRMPNVDDIIIERAHRIGPKMNDRPRNIVAKFGLSSVKDSVFRYVKNLKGKKQFSVQEQLPAEITECRKRLWNKYKTAKADPTNKVKWSLDKLIVNGQTFTAKDDKHEIDPSADDEYVQIVHMPNEVLDNSTYAGHAARLSHKVSVATVLGNLLKDRVIANADHNIYAWRTGRSTTRKEGFSDDGEHGAGHRLLKMLQEKDVTDVIVITTRWFGGKHSGPKRFDTIRKCASDALEKLSEHK